jgi:hypothetical protein
MLINTQNWALRASAPLIAALLILRCSSHIKIKPHEKFEIGKNSTKVQGVQLILV